MYDLKYTQLNIQHSLIRELLAWEFQLSHIAGKATQNKSVVDLSNVTRLFKKFGSGCKNLVDMAMSGWPKIVDYEAMRQAIEVNLMSYPSEYLRWLVIFSTTGEKTAKFSITLQNIVHFLIRFSMRCEKV